MEVVRLPSAMLVTCPAPRCFLQGALLIEPVCILRIVAVLILSVVLPWLALWVLAVFHGRRNPRLLAAVLRDRE